MAHLLTGTHILPFVGAIPFAPLWQFILHGSFDACDSWALGLSHPEGGCLAGMVYTIEGYSQGN